MSTIVIETSDFPSQRFEIDLAKEPREFADEVRNLVAKLETRTSTQKKIQAKRLSPRLRRASRYIDSITDRPASRIALAEADRIREDWIRNNG